jgi:hypothetical protein
MKGEVNNSRWRVELRCKNATHGDNVDSRTEYIVYYLQAVEDFQSRFLENGWRTPILEARIVIYDQIWVYNSVFKTFSTETLSTAARSYFLPLSRAAGRDGAARRDHPSQGHGSSPAALHQMPRCTADECTSIVPGQFSFGPDFDAELPAVPAPQSVVLHPHQLHISTSRELLAYP